MIHTNSTLADSSTRYVQTREACQRASNTVAQQTWNASNCVLLHQISHCALTDLVLYNE